jgi:TatD DNase family protein
VIDSHCHLNFPSIRADIKNVLKRSHVNGVTKLLTINTNPNEFDYHYNLIKDFDNVYIAYGIHPEEVRNSSHLSFEDIEDKIKNSRVIGLGETGLDFFHSIEFKKKQYEIFESHIEASKVFDLPIIIHQRNSEKEIIEVLKKYKNEKLKIVFHCFTGSKDLLEFCNENKYYISLSGIVTFKNANLLRETIKNASLDYLLVETDSPFLAPTPMRGKDNEPSFVKFTADYLANFYSIEQEEFYKLTDNNFYKLFSRAKEDS